MITIGGAPLDSLRYGASPINRAYLGADIIWPPDARPLFWPGIQAWWRADARWTLDLDGNGGVVNWRDSKNGYVVSQPVAARRPQWSHSSFAGTPGITFSSMLQTFLTMESVPWQTGLISSGFVCVLDQLTPASKTTSTTIASYGQGPVGQRKAQRLVRVGVNRAGLAIGNGWTEDPYYNPRIDFTGRHSMLAWFQDVGSIANADDSEFAGVSSFALRTPPTGRTRFGCDSLDVPGEFCDAIVRDILVINGMTLGSQQEFLDYVTWSYGRVTP